MFDVEAFVAECRAALTEEQAVVAGKEVLERVLSNPAATDEKLECRAAAASFRCTVPPI